MSRPRAMRRRRGLYALLRSARGAAAVEFGLLLPFLMVLCFGVIEVSRLLFHYHTVEKSVEDAVRFLARSPGPLDCDDVDTWKSRSFGSETVQSAARNLALTGQIDPQGAEPLLYYWTDPSSVTISVTCVDNPVSGNLPRYRYPGNARVPTIQVSAQITYVPLIAAFIVGNSLSLSSIAQARFIGE
jgi:Flp pilus assembly protein TadG